MNLNKFLTVVLVILCKIPLMNSILQNFAGLAILANDMF